jgi:hypothetical protein
MSSRTNAAYSPAHMTQVPVVPGASDTTAVFAIGRVRNDIGGYGSQGAGWNGGREPLMQEAWGAGAPHAGSLSPREMEAAW